MSSEPYPRRWYGGSVRMHARLYSSSDAFSFEKYPTATCLFVSGSSSVST